MMQWPDEIGPFFDWLKSLNPQHVLEIGTGPGGVTERFCQMVPGLVVSVDLHGALFPEQMCINRDAILLEQFSNYKPVSGSSHDPAVQQRVAELLAGEKVDLLFIDGDHSYVGVTADFIDYQRFVRKGGWIAFHDINSFMYEAQGCEVPRFWRDFVQNHTVREITVKGEWGGIGLVQV